MNQIKDSRELRERIIEAGYQAVEHLIEVAKERIVDGDDGLTADKLKNAAATKKLAIFDAFEILKRIESENDNINETVTETKDTIQGFAERRSRT
jgi:hypothetical protein